MSKADPEGFRNDEPEEIAVETIENENVRRVVFDAIEKHESATDPNDGVDGIWDNQAYQGEF